MKLGAVILAAGGGTRLGGVAKALLPIGDHTYLDRIVATAREANVTELVVVVAAPFASDVRPQAIALGATVIDNPDPARGMASSIALGFAALAASDAALLWPVDHPFVAPETLRSLRYALQGHAAARPRHQGRGGHPPLIARSLWPALAACADHGARAVLAAADVVEVNVADAGVVRDVDTREDLVS